jgi:hypothetical protein
VVSYLPGAVFGVIVVAGADSVAANGVAVVVPTRAWVARHDAVVDGPSGDRRPGMRAGGADLATGGRVAGGVTSRMD